MHICISSYIKYLHKDSNICLHSIQSLDIIKAKNLSNGQDTNPRKTWGDQDIIPYYMDFSNKSNLLYI